MTEKEQIEDFIAAGKVTHCPKAHVAIGSGVTLSADDVQKLRAHEETRSVAWNSIKAPTEKVKPMAADPGIKILNKALTPSILKAARNPPYETQRRVELGRGFAIYSRELNGRETVSIFGPEPGSRSVGFRGSVQIAAPRK